MAPIVSAVEGLASPPQRVLILSAEMGEGHNAAAAAITAAITEVWPGCEVERFDTWGLRGQRFSRTATWGYRFQMSVLPKTYEVFYDWLCRYDRFAAITKMWIGSFFGRALERFLASRHYDLVISTYPFGSAALDWLRTHRAYLVPTVTYVPAFHVHPYWTYPGIHQHFVMYDTASIHARTPGFERTMRVGAPPVTPGFGTVSKAAARTLLEFDQDRFIVLVTGGAWGLGGISEAVQALVTGDQDVQVIAVCGRSVKLAEELRALGAPPERLRVLPYVSNMHELMAASDVVVTNGAGVTVLEALATPRPVIAFRPLAGHGKASTAEMIRRDLALVAHDVPALVSVVRRLAVDEELMRRMELAGRTWVKGRDLRVSVREMEQLLRSTNGRHTASRNGGGLSAQPAAEAAAG
jgi:diacylglycerol O-acyltransferase